MLLLAVETSGRRGSVALFREQELIRESVFPEGLIHGREITARIEAILQYGGHRPLDLTAIALSVGPGSFTGIRVGVTTAKAMAFALKIPVVTESSLRVVAANAVRSEGDDEAGWSVASPQRCLLTVLDARQGAYFWGVHEILNRDAGSLDATIQRLDEDAVDEPPRIAALVGNRESGGLVIGEGAQVFLARQRDFPWPRGPAGWDLPSARVLGELTAARARAAVFDLEATHRLEPAYLRATEAERKLAARGGA